MTDIPIHLPSLSSGSHSPTSGYACVMEYVSVLAGETWSDSPSCTDPMIASMARNLNDSMYGPGQRLALVDLVGRLMAAKFPSGQQHLRTAFYAFAEQHLRKRTEATGPSPEHLGLALVHPIAWMPNEALNNLVGMLDRMDAMLNRPTAEQPSRERLAEATAAIGIVRQYGSEESSPTAPQYASGGFIAPISWVIEGEKKPLAWFHEGTLSMDLVSNSITFKPDTIAFAK